jgi:hypothetical protein
MTVNAVIADSAVTADNAVTADSADNAAIAVTAESDRPFSVFWRSVWRLTTHGSRQHG